MSIDPKMVGQNLYLLIGGLVFCTAIAIFLLAAVTTGKLLLWRRDVERSEAAYKRVRRAPDGTPFPNSSPGLCDRCGQAFARVYHAAGGRRCEACFLAEHAHPLRSASHPPPPT